jgi:trans-aconitate 2-methyltransferase
VTTAPTSTPTPTPTSGDTWNPDQYARFRDERSRPFYELMTLVQPKPGMRAVDLGCGTGELTRDLHRHTGARETIGLDSSQAMLTKARALKADGLRFIEGDIWDFARGSTSSDASERFDLIFSNAALQWVEDHPALITHLAARLAEGGQLAVQVPANEDHASHVTAREVAQEEPFRTALGGHVRRFPLLTPEGYAELLDSLGFAEQHVRLQVFGHHLGGREDVVEWVKGTLLTDYQKRLPPELWDRFLARYRELLLPRLTDTRPYFYAFKRILFWAAKPPAA